MIERAATPFDDLARYDDEAPAVIGSRGPLVTVRHRRFAADIDPFADTARLYVGEGDDSFAVQLTERTMLSARLPLTGGVMLHSAGIVIDGRAAVFFGPSGAGKSTLSSLVSAPVLSDELVIVENGHARASGWFGTFSSTPVSGSYPVSALVELGRGDDVSLTPLDTRAAMRTLLNVTVVPPNARLWDAALRVVTSLIATTPVIRLDWTPSGENAARVLTALSCVPRQTPRFTAG
jgi:hypothetical protein